MADVIVTIIVVFFLAMITLGMFHAFYRLFRRF